MNTNLLNTVKVKIMAYGEAVLDDVVSMGQSFAEQCADEPKSEVLALMLCFTAGYHNELRAAGEAERAEVKQNLALRLHNDEGMDLALCNATLSLLCAALFGEGSVPETPAPTTENTDTGGKENNTAADMQQLKSELLTEDEALKICGREIQQLKKTVQKTKSRLLTAIIAGIIALAVSVFIGVNKYNNLMDDRNSLYDEKDLLEQKVSQLTSITETEKGELESLINSLETEKSALEKLVNSFEHRWSINVTSIKVGNSDDDRWLALPGANLNARDMRYFSPEITYNSLVSDDVILYVKIIDSDGGIKRNPSSSPTGYSYSIDERVIRGSNQKLELSGWGNGDRSTYVAGTWTVEVWFEGVCLRSEKVKLN